MARMEPRGGSRGGRGHSREHVVRKLRKADKLLAGGEEVEDVCRHLGVSIQSYQRRRAQYKAMRPEDVVRLNQLEKENARLKRIVGDEALNIPHAVEVARGDFLNPERGRPRLCRIVSGSGSGEPGR
jgi:putative transposase